MIVYLSVSCYRAATVNFTWDTNDVMWFEHACQCLKGTVFLNGLTWSSSAEMADYQTQYQPLASCEEDTDENDVPIHESANLMMHVVPESSMYLF